MGFEIPSSARGRGDVRRYRHQRRRIIDHAILHASTVIRLAGDQQARHIRAFVKSVYPPLSGPVKKVNFASSMAGKIRFDFGVRTSCK